MTFVDKALIEHLVYEERDWKTYSCLSVTISVANLFITDVIRIETKIFSFLIKLTTFINNKLQYLFRYINYNNSV